MAITLTYYFDPLSQWCYFADQALDKIRERYGSDLVFEWKLAAANKGGPIETSLEAYRWVYRRSRFVSGIETNAAWRREGDSTFHACCAVEAVRGLGADADRLRREFSRAVLIDGKPAGSFDTALELMSALSGIDRAELGNAMRTAESRVRETSAEYQALPVEVVPCILIGNDIGDRTILSGMFRFETFEAVLAELLDASRKYAEFALKEPMPG